MKKEEQIMQTERWEMVELTFAGQETENPFLDTELKATFSCNEEEVTVRGFYDGEGKYKVRFMPDQVGEWSYRTMSNQPELDGQSGTISCVEQKKENHGPVYVADGTHFAYADGTPFYPFGTTAYAWIHQSKELQQQTLETLKESPFNKIRMCVFPKYYEFNTDEPEIYPYEGEQTKLFSGTFDFSDWTVTESDFNFEVFNLEFFRRLDRQIQTLKELDIQVDLILFHPYDHWGFASMGKENDIRYLQYIIARLSAYSNIWWAMANEYDLMEMAKQKKKEDWEDLIQCVIEEDVYNHPISIHNWHHPPIHYFDSSHWYDHANLNISHVSIQHDVLFYIPSWLEKYNKPIMIDECRYEGNLSNGWGNMTAENMVKHFWEGVVQGAYVTHGETYMDEENVIWWSHGGKLKGKSRERIAFLKEIIEEGEPKRLKPLGEDSSHWELMAGISNDSYVLVYFRDSQPAFKILDFLPENVSFKGELIDTWNMTITPLEGRIDRGTRISLPQQPYLALRLYKEG